ncbi:hypothetical protein NB722_003271 [Xanthomonas sacchari]|nr:hypothetical protein [Xanthomonas sacchari]
MLRNGFRCDARSKRRLSRPKPLLRGSVPAARRTPACMAVASVRHWPVPTTQTQNGPQCGPFFLASAGRPAYFSLASARSASARSVFSHENAVAWCWAPVPSV